MGHRSASCKLLKDHQINLTPPFQHPRGYELWPKHMLSPCRGGEGVLGLPVVKKGRGGGADWWDVCVFRRGAD